MPDNLFEQPDNATPLRPEEAAALRVPVVADNHDIKALLVFARS